MKSILTNAVKMAEKLPKDFGRRGRSVETLYNTLPEDIKKCIDARLQTQEAIAEIVDDLVEEKYSTQIAQTVNLVENLYKNHKTRTLFKNSNMTMNGYVSQKHFISGSIIQQYKAMCLV